MRWHLHVLIASQVYVSLSPSTDMFMPRDENINGATLTLEATNDNDKSQVKRFQ